MRATFKLINSYFWKTIYGPILSFLFPIILIAILGNIMRIQYVYPGIIALTMLFIGVLALPLAVMELKQSSLFKYIGSSPVNHMKFSIVVVLYYTLISVLTGFVIMFSAMIIFKDEVFPSAGFTQGIIGGLSTVKGFFSFYIATFIHLILVIAFGLAISTFSKTPQQALTISIVIILPSMFLSGMVLSVDVIAQSQVMQWISRLIPFRYSTGNIVVATTPLNQLGDIYHLISNAAKGASEPTNRELIFGGNVISHERITQITDWMTSEGMTKEVIDKWRQILENNIGNLIVIRPDHTFAVLTTTDGILAEYKYALSRAGESQKWLQYMFVNLTVPSGKTGDIVLFNAIFLKESARFASDNNIFAWDVPWSVRRIPDITQVKDFIVNYLSGGKDQFDPTRFDSITTLIKNNNFGFMDIFLKQNNILYTVPERSLNILIPLTITGISSIYIWKNFSWTSR